MTSEQLAKHLAGHSTNRVGGTGVSWLKCDCGWRFDLYSGDVERQWAAHVIATLGEDAEKETAQ